MKVTQKEFDKLPQLDRIELRQGHISNNHTYVIGLLFAFISMACSFVNHPYTATVFLIIFVCCFFKWFKCERNLKEKYFKVVKR